MAEDKKEQPTAEAAEKVEETTKQEKVEQKTEEKAKEAPKADSPQKSQGKIADLAKQLVELTGLEVKELADIIETEYGIKPAAVGVAAPAAGGGEDQAADSKSEFDVVLKEVGDKKVEVIKAIKELTGIGLGEAKAITDKAPETVKAGVPKNEAEEAKKRLESAGAVVELA